MHDLQPTDSDARALTGVSGLDQLLGGGVPAQRPHLIEGHPGLAAGFTSFIAKPATPQQQLPALDALMNASER